MVFYNDLKEELIKTDIELIELAFKISDKFGESAVESSLSNFNYFLSKENASQEYIPSINLEYRKFVIDLCKAIPDNLLDKAMPVILGLKK